jgi:hypothetical protein
LLAPLDAPLSEDSRDQISEFNQLFVLQARDESMSGGTNYLAESTLGARCPVLRANGRTATYRETLQCLSEMTASVLADQRRMRADLQNDPRDWNRLHPRQALTSESVEGGTDAL